MHLKYMGNDWVNRGGPADPLRGDKTSTWEGGLRVPCIIRAPGKVPAAVETSEVASTMDLLPTFAKLAGTRAPTDRVIDGHDIRDLMHGVSGAQSPTETIYYYRRTRLEAVRSGKWKLFVPIPVDRMWANFSKAEDVIEIKYPMLFNLNEDLGETTDVAAALPEVVGELMKLVEKARADIGDHDRIGKNARFFDPQPRRPDIKLPSPGSFVAERTLPEAKLGDNSGRDISMTSPGSGKSVNFKLC